MTRAHTLTSLVYTSAVLDIRFFFLKQETSEKEKKKQFPFTATSRGDVALLSANRVWAAGLVHSAKPGFAQKH